MTAIFTNTFKAALAADATLLDFANIEMVMFSTAAALRLDEETEGTAPLTTSPYAAIDTIAGLEGMLGWGPSIPQTVTLTLPAAATVEGDAPTTYFAQMNNDIPFKLPSNFPTSLVKAAAFVYKGPSTVAGGYAKLPGTAGNSLSTPDATALDITGTDDLTIVARVALADWTPTGQQTIVAKWAGSNLSYMFRVIGGGTLSLVWSADGSSVLQALSSVVVPATDGAWKWVAATLDVNNGSTANDVRFWTSDNGSAWTQLGITRNTAGVTSIFSGTANLHIGAQSNGTTEPLNGSISHVSVRAGIGASGVVGGTERFGFNGLTNLVGVTPATTTFTATTSQTVTIHRSGSPATDIVQPVSTTNKLMFVTDTPVGTGTVMHPGDGVIPQEDPAKGRIFVSWALDSVIEGPLVREVAPPPFEPARTQHVWIYPMRTNMIANPSFEEDTDFWRSNGAKSQVTTKIACTVRAATLANLAALSGPQTVDTIALVATDRVLVKNQTLAQNNGVYVVAAGAWTRATDADTAAELKDLVVYVKNGSQRATAWQCTAEVDPIVVGTTPLTFVQAVTGGAGNFVGRFAGKVVESNMFPLITRYNETGWTLQMRVRSDGEVKIGFLTWVSDFAATAADWGYPEEIWLPNDGWLAVRTCRVIGEASTGMLRVETQGTYIDLDLVCVEPGTMPANYEDWPYFDGDALYAADHDYSWYERPHKSYSCWYNNRDAAFGRLFAWNVSSEDYAPGGVFTDEEAATQGLARQWVPAGTPLEYHANVLYPYDPGTLCLRSLARCSPTGSEPTHRGLPARGSPERRSPEHRGLGGR